MTDPRPLLAVDGDNFAHRAYHGVPKTVRRASDRPAGAIIGFANFLLRLYQAEQPHAVVVGWDTLDVPNFRQRLFPAYQSGRVFDAAVLEQLALIPEFVRACGFANGKMAGFEADDFLAAAAAYGTRCGRTVLVASGDRDAFQLASTTTTILHPLKAGQMARIDPAGVMDRYGVEPRQVPDFIALRGDPSDKLPGARGVGARTAAILLRRYDTLEGLLADGRFTEEAPALMLYKRIATMDPSAPLPALDDQAPTWPTAAALAREWGLPRLAERIGDIERGIGTEAR
jgi:DNA polymerase I